MNEITNKIRNSALIYLARREHSRLELFNKLIQKGHSPDLINTVLDQLIVDRLLNEERFVEAFVYSKTNKGQGPLKIVAELKQKGICSVLIEQYIDVGDKAWIQRGRHLLLNYAWRFKSHSKVARSADYRGSSIESSSDIEKGNRPAGNQDSHLQQRRQWKVQQALRAKKMRFLQQRGFTLEQVNCIIDSELTDGHLNK